jgi:hypothetical protein
MAILNTLEGPAHVEIAEDGLNWKGYILLEDEMSNVRYFDIVGPKSQCVYEGPIFAKGKYFFASGKVSIEKFNFTQDTFRVDFKGIEKLTISKAFENKPEDYLA